VTSAAVAERVRSLLKSPLSASQLVELVTIEVPPNTTVLLITAEASTPIDAQRVSRTFAKAYLDQREETAKGAIAAQVKILDGGIAEASKRLQTVTGQLSALPANSPDRAYAEAQQRITVDQITNLNDQRNKLKAITVTPGRVLSDAALPTDPEQPPPAALLGGGLLFGLIVGLGLALLMARLDRRIRRPADLQALGDVPLLGSIPPGRSAAKGAPLPAIAPSASPIGQAFGQIRNDVTTALPMRPATLLVAGTEAGVANSVVAANLAVALARSGAPVLLVCADLAGSSVERMLGLEGLTRADGLSEALSGQGEPLTLLRAAPVVPGLWVLGAGRGRDSAIELLQSRQLEWVLGIVRGESFVILEAPPTSAGAEAQAMARLCDAAVLVAEVGRSRLDTIDDGAHQLARVGTPLLGVVVSSRQSPPKRKRRGGDQQLEATAGGQPERASLGETTVAIRADQLAALRASEPERPGQSAGSKAGRARPPAGSGTTQGPSAKGGDGGRGGEARATAGRSSRRRPGRSPAEDSDDGLSADSARGEVYFSDSYNGEAYLDEAYLDESTFRADLTVEQAAEADENAAIDADDAPFTHRLVRDVESEALPADDVAAGTADATAGNKPDGAPDELSADESSAARR
jgi:Mrp family chromosome partitioning ATPase/capsular polysaccharide biosynthesis protein